MVPNREKHISKYKQSKKANQICDPFTLRWMKNDYVLMMRNKIKLCWKKTQVVFFKLQEKRICGTKNIFFEEKNNYC